MTGLYRKALALVFMIMASVAAYATTPVPLDPDNPRDGGKGGGTRSIVLCPSCEVDETGILYVSFPASYSPDVTVTLCGPDGTEVTESAQGSVTLTFCPVAGSYEVHIRCGSTAWSGQFRL